LNYFDLVIGLALVVTAIGGYRNGLLQSIFRTIGYIAGGVIGVAIAVEVMSKWSNTLAKAGGAIILILLLATAGEFILGKVGLGFRKALLISPLKLIDSLLGGLLSVIRTSVIAYLIAVIVIATPWSIGDQYITPSNFYTYTELLLPKFLKNISIEVDNLFKSKI
jgi:uncharacterized membrane protein required for colicin V production